MTKVTRVKSLLLKGRLPTWRYLISINCHSQSLVTFIQQGLMSQEVLRKLISTCQTKKILITTISLSVWVANDRQFTNRRSKVDHYHTYSIRNETHRWIQALESSRTDTHEGQARNETQSSCIRSDSTERQKSSRSICTRTQNIDESWAKIYNTTPKHRWYWTLNHHTRIQTSYFTLSEVVNAIKMAWCSLNQCLVQTYLHYSNSLHHLPD